MHPGLCNLLHETAQTPPFTFHLRVIIICGHHQSHRDGDAVAHLINRIHYSGQSFGRNGYIAIGEPGKLPA